MSHSILSHSLRISKISLSRQWERGCPILYCPILYTPQCSAFLGDQNLGNYFGFVFYCLIRYYRNHYSVSPKLRFKLKSTYRIPRFKASLINKHIVSFLKSQSAGDVWRAHPDRVDLRAFSGQFFFCTNRDELRQNILVDP